MRQFVLLREAEERLHDEIIAVRALPLLIRRWDEVAAASVPPDAPIRQCVGCRGRGGHAFSVDRAK
eukprot:7140281-Alexandrium_andersonii.AAC.1